MKKVLKFLLIALVGIILLAVIAYYSFLGWEYITGGKYVDYLINNKETVEINGAFSFEGMKSDIEANKLILVGEIHGFEEPTKFDIHFFKHLYHNFGVRTYLAELDFAQAELINEYIRTGHDSLLHSALKNWIVIQGRNNKDYFDKYRAFHEFYQELPEGDKFKFIGIDRVQDWETATSFLNKISSLENSQFPVIEFDKENVTAPLIERINQILEWNEHGSETEFELRQLLKNIEFYTGKVNRRTAMFQNFSSVYQHYKLSEEKVYGYFGLAHVFQYRINGRHPLASLIRESDLGLADKILSMNFLFVDSYMVRASKALPEFMRDEGKFTRMKISSDNVLFMYLVGIMDYKRSTPENHKSLIKMNGEDNPYSNSNRMTKTIQLLPVTDVFEMTDKGKPYVQYTIFVRNSDWAEPM
jgi:hypothetical protein